MVKCDDPRLLGKIEIGDIVCMAEKYNDEYTITAIISGITHCGWSGGVYSHEITCHYCPGKIDFTDDYINSRIGGCPGINDGSHRVIKIFNKIFNDFFEESEFMI